MRAGLEPEGDWAASRDPIKHKDPNFEEVPFVEYFEDEVSWSIKLRVPSGAPAGTRAPRCQAALHDLQHVDLQQSRTMDDS